MLEQQIDKDYITAMKARDTVKSSTLNFLRAQIKNVRIDKRVEQIDEADVVAVIKKQIKQRQDSIEQYTQGNRQDLADKEMAELNILKGYLPAEMSETELKEIVAQAIKESGAASIKDMGNVMKVMMPKVAGKADNKLVSELVKQALTSL